MKPTEIMLCGNLRNRVISAMNTAFQNDPEYKSHSCYDKEVYYKGVELTESCKLTGHKAIVASWK